MSFVWEKNSNQYGRKPRRNRSFIPSFTAYDSVPKVRVPTRRSLSTAAEPSPGQYTDNVFDFPSAAAAEPVVQDSEATRTPLGRRRRLSSSKTRLSSSKTPRGKPPPRNTRPLRLPTPQEDKGHRERSSTRVSKDAVWMCGVRVSGWVGEGVCSLYL